MNISLFKNDQGSVLITAVGLVLVMMAMGICLSKISVNELNHATLKIKKESANYAAETGWMVAARWLQDQVPSVTEDILRKQENGAPAHADHNPNLRGGLNNTSSVQGRASMPAWYDADIHYEKPSGGHEVDEAPEGEDAGKYDLYNYTITSYGYVSRDLAQRDTTDEIRKSGRFTEVIVHYGKKVEQNNY